MEKTTDIWRGTRSDSQRIQKCIAWKKSYFWLLHWSSLAQIFCLIQQQSVSKHFWVAEGTCFCSWIEGHIYITVQIACSSNKKGFQGRWLFTCLIWGIWDHVRKMLSRQIQVTSVIYIYIHIYTHIYGNIHYWLCNGHTLSLVIKRTRWMAHFVP